MFHSVSAKLRVKLVPMMINIAFAQKQFRDDKLVVVKIQFVFSYALIYWEMTFDQGILGVIDSLLWGFWQSFAMQVIMAQLSLLKKERKHINGKNSGLMNFGKNMFALLAQNFGWSAFCKRSASKTLIFKPWKCFTVIFVCCEKFQTINISDYENFRTLEFSDERHVRKY